MQTNSIHNSAQASSPSIFSLIAKLHSVKLQPFGAGGEKINPKVLTDIFSHLATLLENGVTLPKALTAVADEPSLKKQRPILVNILNAIERGSSFSAALSEQGNTFDTLMVQQIKIGEKSGTVAEVLRRISENLENTSQLKRNIIKRLSYPVVVTTSGFGVSLFMILFIVPVFQNTYKQSNMQLPFATQLLINIGDFLSVYGWIMLIAFSFAIFVFRKVRQDERLGPILDGNLLKLPIIGPWMRDYSMLQFMDTLGTMLESGYKLADALAFCCGTVSNKAVDQAISKISQAIMRGERLSNEMGRHAYLFSPVVSQLVIIGEQTGNLSKSSRQVREHLKKDLERKADTVVNALEPILTIFMAIMIGGILLAIYSPMFGMLDLVDK